MVDTSANRKRGKAVTIKDIARESGYAVGTVSRVLNHHPNVSPEAREKVMAVVERYGFQPNSNARRLKQQGSNCLAVVVKGANNLLFASLVETIQSIVKEKDYSLIVSYQDEDGDEVEAAREIQAERKPLGIIFLGGNRDNFRRGFGRIRCPAVLLTTRAEDLGFENLSSVSTDDVSGAMEAVNCLLEAGHRSIGLISGQSSFAVDEMGCNTSQSRFTGCRLAFESHGVPFDIDRQTAVARYSMQGGYEGAGQLLERCGDLTAIFAMSDVMAVGAMRAIRDHGKRVPEDISVIGYDGIELADFTSPKLTTIRQDGDKLVRRGVEILLDAIEHDRPAVHEIVPHCLSVGESVSRHEN